MPACEYQSLKWREVAAGRILEAGDEILDRRRLAVVALEIEIHAAAESRRRPRIVCSMRISSAPFS